MTRLATRILMLVASLHLQPIFAWTSSSLTTLTGNALAARAKHGVSDRVKRCRRRVELCAISFGGQFSTHGALASSIETPELPNLLVPIVAIVLLVASQTFINQMLSGDQGLGAYLKDGRGVGRSSFRPLSLDDKSRAVASDPLPWLKLPKLDYVQVAGQESEKDDSDMAIEDGDLDGLRRDGEEYLTR